MKRIRKTKIISVLVVVCLAAVLIGGCGENSVLKQYYKDMKALENASYDIRALSDATMPLLGLPKAKLDQDSAWVFDGGRYVHELTLFGALRTVHIGITDDKVSAVVYIIGDNPSELDMIALYVAMSDVFGEAYGAYVDLEVASTQQAAEALLNSAYTEIVFMWAYEDCEISIYLCRDPGFRLMNISFVQ